MPNTAGGPVMAEEFAQAGPASAVPSNRAPGQRRWWLTWAMLAVLLLCLLAVSTLLFYSSRSAKAWNAEAERVGGELLTTQQQRDEVTSDLEVAQESLADVTQRYNEATARIRSLANEKAQAGDEVAWLGELTKLSGDVTAELDVCVDRLQQLQVYLVDWENYDIDQLMSFAQETNEGCNDARADNAAPAAALGAR